MNLTIEFKDKNITLELFDSGQLVDTSQLPVASRLDTTLIEAIDKLLRKNKMGILDLKQASVRANGEGQYSSALRVAQTVVSAINSR